MWVDFVGCWVLLEALDPSACLQKLDYTARFTRLIPVTLLQ